MTIPPKRGDELLLDGTVRVKVLAIDRDGDFGVLVAHQGVRWTEWVEVGRLVRYADARREPGAGG